MTEENTMTEIRVPTRVDLAFPMTGEQVPVEHGYALFGALCRLLGDLHGAEWLSVHPLRGVSTGDGMLRLRPHNLALRLRIDPVQLPRVLPLAGSTLTIDGHESLIGVSRVFALEPAETLSARLVIIKNGLTREDFLGCLDRKLEAMGVRAVVEVPTRPTMSTGPHTDGRRVLRIRDQTIVGYPVILRGLSAPDSLRVQALGIGGRQRFGCGVFSPVRSEG